ncbi:uncharacterized protein LOC111633000 [Centruroides sculpturatus]|uniref:uncharacterized protein LOC111633000 n=1 Tax=Centruroides sculpturatus TaxID=218467 RepID=UPI000C6D3D02|nr:uncharacterized protein LOC111633000 [Centruroides sculpturatus]
MTSTTESTSEMTITTESTEMTTVTSESTTSSETTTTTSGYPIPPRKICLKKFWFLFFWKPHKVKVIKNYKCKVTCEYEFEHWRKEFIYRKNVTKPFCDLIHHWFNFDDHHWFH